MMERTRATTTVENGSQWRPGLLAGVGIGIAVWVVYFIQASTLDGPFWDVTVAPLLLAIAVGALVASALRPQRRAWWLGFAIGAGAMLPLVVLVALFVMFQVFNLE